MDNLSWLAGILEGEGTFYNVISDSKSISRITMSSVDEDTISRVATMLETSYHMAKSRKENWSDCYRVLIGRKKAQAFMISIFSFMGDRRKEQITKALGYIPLVSDSLDEKEWLIGLLEGEGSFIKASDRNSPIIKIQMTDKDIIERVAKIWNVKCSKPFISSVPNRKSKYTAKIVGRRAADLMLQIMPRMSIRRQAQISRVLESFTWSSGIGEQHHQAKLTEEQVRHIKQELRKDQRGIASHLAKQFGVDQKTITWIKQGKTWSHVKV